VSESETALSLVVLTRERPGPLRRCLDSFPARLPAGVEALLVVNGGAPDARALRAESAARRPWLRVEILPGMNRGAARNRAAALARGRFVHFLDDDTILPPGFVDRLLAALARHPRASALGGPNVGAPSATTFQRAVEALLRSPLGAGPMRVRYAPSGAERAAPGWSLMLCNLGVRREALLAHGLSFPASASAEENWLVWQLERLAGPAVYCPSLWVYHERRAELGAFCRQVFQSGQGRVQISRLEPRSFLPVTVVPALFFAYLAALPWAAPRAAWLCAPAALYAACCVAQSLRLALAGRDPAAAARLAWLFPAAHAAYAAGMLAGLAELARGLPRDAYFDTVSPESHRPPSWETT
jgi:succinoglycan biosynthesis protein ExoA